MHTTPFEEDLQDSLRLALGFEILQIIETPSSLVFLGKELAFKIRRRFPMVHLLVSATDPQELTRIEFMRGNRLCPSVYKGLSEIFVNGESYRVLTMQRLPTESLLENRLRDARFCKEDLFHLAHGVNDLHLRSPPSPLRAVPKDLGITLDFLENIVNCKWSLSFSNDPARRAILRLRRYVEENRDKLQARCSRGLVIDSHGDLHADNVFLGDSTAFIDPSVASSHMYQLDYLAQLADIFVELIVKGQIGFQKDFLECLELARDDQDVEILLTDLYIPLRALLRVGITSVYAKALHLKISDDKARDYATIANGS